MTFFLLAGNTPNQFKPTEVARSQTEFPWEWYGVDVDLFIPNILCNDYDFMLVIDII